MRGHANPRQAAEVASAYSGRTSGGSLIPAPRRLQSVRKRMGYGFRRARSTHLYPDSRAFLNKTVLLRTTRQTVHEQANSLLTQGCKKNLRVLPHSENGGRGLTALVKHESLIRASVCRV